MDVEVPLTIKHDIYVWDVDANQMLQEIMSIFAKNVRIISSDQMIKKRRK
jgi:hypothetical protein